MIEVILGISLLLLMLADAFITVLSRRGAGPLTGLWTPYVWKACLWFHRLRRVHGPLSFVGPLMLVLAVVSWYAMLITGWCLVFASSSSSVINAETKADATPIQTLYFTTTTVSSLGYGDYVPSDFPWTLLATTSAFTGTFLLTISLTYIFSVLSTALRQRQLAGGIFALGETPAELIGAVWKERPQAATQLNQEYVMRLFSQISEHTEQYLVFPVLHFFHSPERRRAPSLAVLTLADALFLIGCAEDESRRPPETLQKVGWSALEDYAKLKRTKLDIPERPSAANSERAARQRLTDAGIVPIGEEDFAVELARYQPLRKKLIDLCVQDGWLQ
jgi:hypothetical protein